MAHGSVIARHGDYYGTVVNLAARLVDTAVPGEVLADAGVAAAVAGAADAGFTVEPAGRRLLKGFADPVPVVSVIRRALTIRRIRPPEGAESVRLGQRRDAAATRSVS